MIRRSKAPIYAAIIIALAGIVACSTTKYVPVESVRTEYRDREVETFVADTVHNTRFVWVKGDTVVDIREKEHIRRKSMTPAISSGPILSAFPIPWSAI